MAATAAVAWRSTKICSQHFFLAIITNQLIAFFLSFFRFLPLLLAVVIFLPFFFKTSKISSTLRLSKKDDYEMAMLTDGYNCCTCLQVTGQKTVEKQVKEMKEKKQMKVEGWFLCWKIYLQFDFVGVRRVKKKNYGFEYLILQIMRNKKKKKEVERSLLNTKQQMAYVGIVCWYMSVMQKWEG